MSWTPKLTSQASARLLALERLQEQSEHDLGATKKQLTALRQGIQEAPTIFGLEAPVPPLPNQCVSDWFPIAPCISTRLILANGLGGGAILTYDPPSMYWYGCEMYNRPAVGACPATVMPIFYLLNGGNTADWVLSIIWFAAAGAGSCPTPGKSCSDDWRPTASGSITYNLVGTLDYSNRYLMWSGIANWTLSYQPGAPGTTWNYSINDWQRSCVCFYNTTYIADVQSCMFSSGPTLHYLPATITITRTSDGTVLFLGDSPGHEHHYCDFHLDTTTNITITIVPTSARFTTLVHNELGVAAGTTLEQSLSPVPATGFRCIASCEEPIKQTLLLHDSRFGNFNLDYVPAAGNWQGGPGLPGTFYRLDNQGVLFLNGSSAFNNALSVTCFGGGNFLSLNYRVNSKPAGSPWFTGDTMVITER